MAGEIEKGVNTLKHLPPIALVAILAVGVGGVLYLRSHKGKAADSTPSDDATVDSYQPEQLVALERGPVGSLPQSAQQPFEYEGELTPPRRDVPAQPQASNNQPVPGLPTTPTNTPGGTANASKPNPITQPVRPAVPPTITPAPVVPRNPVPGLVKHYPGLPDNYVMHCERVAYRPYYAKSYDEAYALVKSKGINQVSINREMINVALCNGAPGVGVATKGREYGRDTLISTNRAYLNNMRVYAGLKPLTEEEMDTMAAEMSRLWDGHGEAPANYARTLHAHWNVPYQCK